jgi:hypothetical protein
MDGRRVFTPVRGVNSYLRLCGSAGRNISPHHNQQGCCLVTVRPQDSVALWAFQGHLFRAPGSWARNEVCRHPRRVQSRPMKLACRMRSRLGHRSDVMERAMHFTRAEIEGCKDFSTFTLRSSHYQVPTERSFRVSNVVSILQPPLGSETASQPLSRPTPLERQRYHGLEIWAAGTSGHAAVSN